MYMWYSVNSYFSFIHINIRTCTFTFAQPHSFESTHELNNTNVMIIIAKNKLFLLLQ